MKFHYVVSYDEGTKKWRVEGDQQSFMPDGSVWGAEEGWMFIPEKGSDEERLDYYHITRLDDIIKAANVKRIRLVDTKNDGRA
jgi:hypothetical protein